MPPKVAHRFAISLENEIAVASRQFEAYLIISAVRGLVRTRSTPSNPAYASSRAARLRPSSVPRTTRSGLRKSRTASPSVRISGLVATPKSTPALFPDASSSSGSTTCSVVPGTTVLFTTTT